MTTATRPAPLPFPILGNQFVTIESAGVWPYLAIARCASCGESMTYTQAPDGFIFERAHRMRHGQYVNGRAVPLREHRP